LGLKAQITPHEKAPSKYLELSQSSRSPEPYTTKSTDQRYRNLSTPPILPVYILDFVSVCKLLLVCLRTAFEFSLFRAQAAWDEPASSSCIPRHARMTLQAAGPANNP
jgi:hypothetical protein